MGLSVLEHQISGPFSRSTWSARFKDMLDGQSNLIMVGEILPEKSRFMARGWMHCDANWAATTAPLNYPSRDRWDYVRTRDCRWYDNWQTSQGFKSQHPDGANFAMADGSYRFIRSDIDYLTYQRLGDRNDGQDVAHR